MKNIFLLALGIAAGVAAYRLIQLTPEGKSAIEDFEARIGDFSQAVKDGYNSRDTELRDS